MGPDHMRVITRLSNTFHVKQRFNAVALNRDMAQFPAMDRRVAVKQFMERRGLKPSPWAKTAGVRESTLRDFLSGRNATMTIETIDKLAAAVDATAAEIIGEKIREGRPGKDVVAIKSLEVRASMGSGYEVLAEPEGPPFFFRRDWIDKILGGEPGLLRVMTTLEGDSMLPTIHEGDIGLVQLPGEETKFQSGAIYVLWDGHGLVVKRLEAMVGDRPRLRVISDNRAIYEPYEIDAEDVRIIGRLIWRGGLI